MDVVQMPAVQGESIELSSRLRTVATCRPPSRGSLRGVERLNSSPISMITRPATSGGNRPTTKLCVPVCGSHTAFQEEVQEPEGGEAESSPLRLSPECQGGEKGDGGAQSTRCSDAEVRLTRKHNSSDSRKHLEVECRPPDLSVDVSRTPANWTAVDVVPLLCSRSTSYTEYLICYP